MANSAGAMLHCGGVYFGIDAHMKRLRITSLPDEMADSVGCGRFRIAMLAKLERKRQEGRGGWNNPAQCSIRRLERMLREHVEKGDPLDIANFAMMIWNRRNPMGVK